MTDLKSLFNRVPKRWILWGGLCAVLAGAVFFLPDDHPGRTPVAAPPPTVETTTVARGSVTEYLAVEGLAQAHRKAFLQFERDGRITTLGTGTGGAPLAIGSRVRRGQILAALEPREASAQVAQAEAALQLARQDLDRQSRLASEGLASQAQREAAQAEFARTEAVLRESRLGSARDTVRAPFDGVVTALNVRTGDMAVPQPIGTTPMERESAAAVVLAAEGALDVDVYVPAEVATLLEIGGRVFVGLPGAHIEAADVSGAEGAAPARIAAIGQGMSLRGRGVPVTLRIDDPPASLLDGALLQAFIELRRVENAVRVPQRALIPRGDRTFVFVFDTETQIVRQRDVDVGALGFDDAEIRRGLAPGDHIVSVGQHLLSDGAQVRIATAASAPIARDASQ